MAVTREARILIVDGDEAIRFTFQRFLALEGYGSISTAASSAEALAFVATEIPYDLVICDMMLDGGHGARLLTRLREAGVDCPVVMITGAPDIDSAMEIARLGAFDYITKPITKQMLLRFVGLALRHRDLQKEKNRLVTESEKYRRHLEAVFRSVQDGLISVDRDLNIILVNDRARKWIADFSGDVVGSFRKLSDIPGEFGSACLADAIEVVRDRAEVKEHRIESTTQDQQVRLLNISSGPVVDDSGAFIGVVIVARDITSGGTNRKRIIQGTFHGFVDNSPAMLEVYNLIENVGKVDTTVLITGESGTGKEVTAEALHAESPRRDGPLVKVDCASIPEDLLESELFGHRKGAFTGADRDRTGRILQADGGTLFLDEIGDISSRLQLRLLRFLQERTFYPVGQDKPIKVDVRVITATNANLQEKVQQGFFREDLFYRLRVVEINLPPLRARREGIPLLVNHFLGKFIAKLKRDITGISDQAMQALINYSWPGNVRELQHTIERACVLCSEPTLTLDCLPQEIIHPVSRTPRQTPPVPDDDHGEPQVSPKVLPGKYLDDARQDSSTDQVAEIVEAIRRSQGNKALAARLLGIDRSTLYRRMRRLNIDDSAKIQNIEQAVP
ncbi:MAG: sigma-54-dependent Fis family transcriptional regulator [Desulfobulbus sp.]|nr:MAG: sigma-54-dependent Fis family transcriptional regulator [Desulfobulbus sp.]